MAGLINYRDDRCISGESIMFETETSLMNYWHDRCMSGTETGLMNYHMLGVCRMEEKC